MSNLLLNLIRLNSDRKQVFFKKKERLKSRRQIDEVFKSGNTLFVYPVKCVYLTSGQSNKSVKVLFSIPKRNFKRAVHRNLLKRRMREAYRLNKHFLSVYDYSLHIAFVYTGIDILRYESIKKAITELLKKIK